MTIPVNTAGQKNFLLKSHGKVFGLSEIDYDIVGLSRMTEGMRSTIKDGYFIFKDSADDVSRIL